jgi:hypothetical protein
MTHTVQLTISQETIGQIVVVCLILLGAWLGYVIGRNS